MKNLTNIYIVIALGLMLVGINTPANGKEPTSTEKENLCLPIALSETNIPMPKIVDVNLNITGTKCPEDTPQTNSDIPEQLAYLKTSMKALQVSFSSAPLNGITDQRRLQIISWLTELNSEIQSLEQKYANSKPSLKESDMSPQDLSNFNRLFELFVDELRKGHDAALLPQTDRASCVDPSYCANHCYLSCGYATIGDKICWRSCYGACCNGAKRNSFEANNEKY
ncbi:MAG: hypothetical protein GX410_00600 [Elusimicrobia bacterium]|nr:hypothetical protein [Elusimicrobiota bacterium]